MAPASFIIPSKKIRPHKRSYPLLPQFRMFSTSCLLLNNKPVDVVKFHESFNGAFTYVIVMQASSSKRLYSLKSASLDFLKRVMEFPTKVDSDMCNVVGVNEHGLFQPRYIPDLSDLALLPKAVRVVYTWMVQNANDEDVDSIIWQLMGEVALSIPSSIELFKMEEGYYRMKLGSFSNAFKIIQLDSMDTNILELEITVKDTKQDQRDGRTTHIEMYATSEEKYGCIDWALTMFKVHRKRKALHEAWTILVWNCRNMATSSFLTIFHKFDSQINSDVVILVETRVTDVICRRILNSIRCRDCTIVDPEGLGGGVCMVSLGNAISIQPTIKNTNFFKGVIQCVTL